MSILRILVPLLGLVLSSRGFSAALKSIEVGGSNEAMVKFILEGTKFAGRPVLAIRENRIEATLSGVQFANPMEEKIDLNSPHVLLSQISAFPVRDGGIRVTLLVNGSLERLRDRLSFTQDGNNLLLKLAFPATHDPSLGLLKEEQQPLRTVSDAKPSRAGSGIWSALVLVLVLAAAGGGTFAIAKVVKKQGSRQGTRKFLVETLAYSPIAGNPKAGVAVLKVGSDLVLVGVTANQVTMISDLPKLNAQFESEQELERESFRDAVSDEVRRLKRPVRAGAVA